MKNTWNIFLWLSTNEMQQSVLTYRYALTSEWIGNRMSKMFEFGTRDQKYENNTFFLAAADERMWWKNMFTIQLKSNSLQWMLSLLERPSARENIVLRKLLKFRQKQIEHSRTGMQTRNTYTCTPTPTHSLHFEMCTPTPTHVHVFSACAHRDTTRAHGCSNVHTPLRHVKISGRRWTVMTLPFEDDLRARAFVFFVPNARRTNIFDASAYMYTPIIWMHIHKPASDNYCGSPKSIRCPCAPLRGWQHDNTPNCGEPQVSERQPNWRTTSLANANWTGEPQKLPSKHVQLCLTYGKWCPSVWMRVAFLCLSCQTSRRTEIFDASAYIHTDCMDTWIKTLELVAECVCTYTKPRSHAKTKTPSKHGQLCLIYGKWCPSVWMWSCE